MKKSTQNTNIYDKSPPDIGIRGTQCPAVTNKEIRYSIDFFLSKLVAPQLKANLKITVRLKTNKQMGTMFGYVEPTDDAYSPRNFSLCLNKNVNRETLLRTIAHECVHIRQIAKRQFDPTLRSGHCMKWCGELVYVGEEEVYEQYLFYPWEVEANGLELALFNSYTEHLRAYNASLKCNDDTPLQAQA